MARTIIDAGREYEVFPLSSDGLKEAQERENEGVAVYVAHPCHECGVELFGTVQAALQFGSSPICEEHHG